MNFPLPNPPARVTLIAGSAVLAVTLCYFGIRGALAAHAFGADTREGYQRTVQLEPTDPRNWYFLGRAYLYDFEPADPAMAVQSLRKSVELDPYSSEAWLELAAAYESQSDSANARQAYLSALRVYPLSADANWSYGNFLLREGEQEQGFTFMRKAVEVEPRRAAEAFSRALRVQPDANLLLEKLLPASPAAYLPVLRLLSDSGDLENAQRVWGRLVELRQKVPMREISNFFEAMLYQGRVADVNRLWPKAAGIMQNAPPPDPAGSLVWDGGFESGYLGWGFAWLPRPTSPDIQMSLDRSEKHSGEQSLRILFNGRLNIDFEDCCHIVATEAGRRYVLSGWIKTQSLTSSEGVRLQIFARSPTKNDWARTEEVHGTQEWKHIQMEWTAPAGTEFATICARRLMSDKPESNIQGAAWIDDVSLVPVEEAEAKP